MISWLMGATGLSSVFVWLIVGGIAVSAVFGYGLYQHHTGYNEAKIEYTLRIETMKKDYAVELANALEKQSQANELAKRNESQLIIDYESKIAERDKIIKENEDAAKKDSSPNAGCITSNGWLRLKRIE